MQHHFVVTDVSQSSLKKIFFLGTDLFTSFYNPATQITCFDNKIPHTHLIIRWCTENMRPYDIVFIYSELNKVIWYN